jgi:hypothetical protein
MKWFILLGATIAYGIYAWRSKKSVAGHMLNLGFINIFITAATSILFILYQFGMGPISHDYSLVVFLGALTILFWPWSVDLINRFERINHTLNLQTGVLFAIIVIICALLFDRSSPPLSLDPLKLFRGYRATTFSWFFLIAGTFYHRWHPRKLFS